MVRLSFDSFAAGKFPVLTLDYTAENPWHPAHLTYTYLSSHPKVKRIEMWLPVTFAVTSHQSQFTPTHARANSTAGTHISKINSCRDEEKVKNRKKYVEPPHSHVTKDKHKKKHSKINKKRNVYIFRRIGWKKLSCWRHLNMAEKPIRMQMKRQSSVEGGGK